MYVCQRSEASNPYIAKLSKWTKFVSVSGLALLPSQFPSGGDMFW